MFASVNFGRVLIYPGARTVLNPQPLDRSKYCELGQLALRLSAWNSNKVTAQFYRLDLQGCSAEAFPAMPPPRKTSSRQRVLAQWRGIDLAPLETAQAIRARRVGDVLPRVTKDLRMDQRRAEVEIVKVWNSLIDPNIVAHAQPAGVRNGTLFVNVDSSVWLSEIVRYRRREILDRLQYSFGRDLIRRISFRVG
jgi:hypothetical protein